MPNITVRVAGAIGQATQAAPLRQKAAELGRALRAEPDGVLEAVRQIETAR